MDSQFLIEAFCRWSDLLNSTGTVSTGAGKEMSVSGACGAQCARQDQPLVLILSWQRPQYLSEYSAVSEWWPILHLPRTALFLLWIQGYPKCHHACGITGQVQQEWGRQNSGSILVFYCQVLGLSLPLKVGYFLPEASPWMEVGCPKKWKSLVVTELLHVKFNHLGTCGAGDALVRSQDMICQWRAVVPKSQSACVF